MSRGERTFAYALIACALLMFFSLNLLTPILRDDWSYTFNFLTKEPIRSFHDIEQSLTIHYQKVNGRLPVHFLAHLFLWMGKGAFNVVNTLAFALLVTLVYFHAFGTLRPFRPYAWLAAYVGLWGLAPAFGESFLWVTGAANYLYGMLLILCFLVPYRRLADGNDMFARRRVSAVFCVLPGALLAGWTNENTAGALLILLLCLLAWRLAERKRVPAWFYAGLLGVAAGLAVMVLAPGELTRLDNSGGTGGLASMLRRAVSVTECLARYFWPGVVLWTLLFVCVLRRKGEKRALVLPLSFLLAGLAAAYAMAIPPQMPRRVWSGPLLYCLISLLSLWNVRGGALIRSARLRAGLVTLCAALAFTLYAASAPKLAATRAAFDAREAEAAEQLAAGRRALTLPSVHGSGARIDAADVAGDIAPDASYWLNQALAHYLGADSVAAE